MLHLKRCFISLNPFKSRKMSLIINLLDTKKAKKQLTVSAMAAFL